MPGILPMKVIKVGTSSQSRIAQACDRCRSKKIRCDGIRPCCSQCANVGFECRTSDKLSRRAFPRGYTESLEERVRQLESENRELKDLLDEKDEKIEMLSKMHSNQHRSPQTNLPSPAQTEISRKDRHTASKDDSFRVQASPLLLGVENSDSYFMGPSSGRSFIEGFKRKIQEHGKSCSDFNIEAFLHIQGCFPLATRPLSMSGRIPPRLFSDRCVNVFFQEWGPLFPVLHKPTFLDLYETFTNDADKVKSNHKIAQLYLVFAIAALSSERPDMDQIAACEFQWQKALDAVLMENTMLTLQCLVLALIYCTVRADYKRLQHYKAIAVGLSHRLGLHQSQKRFSFGALTIETRKKVFWTLYTLDCFTAAVLGLPKLIKEEDVQAEYPCDTDDEYVTEKGFQPTLPGEYTRLSSGLALFKLSRLLAKVIEKLYPAATSYELSLPQISALDIELADWSQNLPPHLKLNFTQDKPATDVTGSRSPLLALAYYYVRILIHRPAVGTTLGGKAAPALIAIGECSKHIVQIIQLLEERNMSMSFCLNKIDTLVLAAMTLLYQGLDLKQDSKLAKDAERLVNTVIKILHKAEAPGTNDLTRVASMLINVEETTPVAPRTQISPERGMAAPPPRMSPLVSATQQKHAHSLGHQSASSINEANLLAQQRQNLRRMTLPNNLESRPGLYRTHSRGSVGSSVQDLEMLRDQRFSIAQIQQSMMRASQGQKAKTNMDYLSLSNTPTSVPNPSSPLQTRVSPPRHLPPPQQQQQAQQGQRSLYPTQPPMNPKDAQRNGISLAEWETLLGALDGGQVNVYDAIYGGPSLSLVETPGSVGTNVSEWSPDSWDLTNFNLGDMSTTNSAPAQSVLSLSDESLSSGDELATSDVYFNMSAEEHHHGTLLQTPRSSVESNPMLDGIEHSFGL